MRIISGTLKGRKLYPPNNLPVRPTTDLARESLFNILRNLVYFDQCDVLDLFSGTGSISFEFLSRGVKSVTAVEIHFSCVDFIRKTAESFDLTNIKVVKSNVFNFLGFCKVKYDVIFADPPYKDENITDLHGLVFKNELLKPQGWLIIEHNKAVDFKSFDHYVETRRYGKVHFSFFRHQPDTSSNQ